MREDHRLAVQTSQGVRLGTKIVRTHAPDGFNLGVNVGDVAGQTVFTCICTSFHATAAMYRNPRGGVRAYSRPSGSRLIMGLLAAAAATPRKRL